MKNTSQTIIAVAVMLGFLFFWETFVASRYSFQKPEPSPVNKITATPAAPSASSTPTHLVSPNGSAPSDNSDALTVLETDNAKVSFLSHGARVASWQIKERDHWIETVAPEKSRVTSPLETFPELNFSSQKKSDTEGMFQATLPNGVVVTKTVTCRPSRRFIR